MKIKENSHIGCIVLLILAAVAFIVFSIPRLKEMETQRAIKQNSKDSVVMTRAWHIVDSVRRAELMDNPYYYELYEENIDLKDRLDDIRNTVEEMQEHIDYFESKGFDVSDMQAIMDNIVSTSDY